MNNVKNTQQDWYATPASDAVLEQEKHVLSALPIKSFRPQILQMGGGSAIDFSSFLKFVPEKQIYLREDLKFPPDNTVETRLIASLQYICSSFIDLPFFPASMDIAVLFHVLEFSKAPRQILREVYDILAKDGYAVIFGFNPYSLLGLRRPHYGHYISPKKLRLWLEELGFDILEYETFFFRPLAKTHRKLKKLLFLEGLGPTLYPACGGIYMFLLKKKMMIVTPIKESILEQFTKGMHLERDFVKPTARIIKNEKLKMYE